MPSAFEIPQTPLLTYFCGDPYATKGEGWQVQRLAEAKRLLADTSEIAARFDESVRMFASAYENYQPFHSGGRTLSGRGINLKEDKDVAARLAHGGPTWNVPGEPTLDFVFLDFELELARTRPAPNALPKSRLTLDLLLAN